MLEILLEGLFINTLIGKACITMTKKYTVTYVESKCQTQVAS